ncbi:peptidylprolyl isomerase FKBP-type [Methanosalsum zhilinae DSM 4017]|uniref:Peptidyl-prolyl cis-trans isomerase n=1 Tax=Methanosalsum zhilinae (strain DSM 4017 / NBRC 107636 / OCM 62 / WeN5) TaxID=679901 RepID=F7XK89_METZD|nr:peptidylprolyl isomerase [Methanosalsum zhilinae]AEH60554.1 peptidylprolyl isomerase FKBP-type [Methanosalsum zhilinae DSM 4017]
MNVEKGDFIKISYTGKFDDGQIFDTTNEDIAKEHQIYNPRGLYGGDVIIVGAGHTIRGLDEELVGKEVGYSGEVSIPPEKAFGEHDPKMVEAYSISKFKDKNVQPGMQVEVEGKRGVVVQVIGRRARVDFNHPLAGKEVTYEYTIENKIEDIPEQIKGLLALYTGIPDIEVEMDGMRGRIITPPEITFNQRWLMSKGRIAEEILENTSVEEIEYVEKYSKQKEEENLEAESEETSAE